MSFFSWPYPPPPDDPVVSVGTRGKWFLINNRPQHLRAFTDFRSFTIFAKHGVLSPLAMQMQQIHRDFVAYQPTPLSIDRDATMPGVPAMSPVVLLMNPWGETEDLNVDSFDPRTFPDYFTKLDQWLTLMNAHRFIPICNLLSFTKIFGMDTAYQRQFVTQACEVLSRHVCLVDLVLEWDAGDSATDPMDFDKPANVIISRGSSGGGVDMPYPYWDWCSVHPRRDDKWLQTIADSGYAYRHDGAWGDGKKPAIPVPILMSEQEGFGEPGDNGRSFSTSDAFKQAVDNALWGCSSSFHSEAGTRSQVLGTVSQNCAITSWRGVYAVPEVQIQD